MQGCGGGGGRWLGHPARALRLYPLAIGPARRTRAPGRAPGKQTASCTPEVALAEGLGSGHAAQRCPPAAHHY